MKSKILSVLKIFILLGIVIGSVIFSEYFLSKKEIEIHKITNVKQLNIINSIHNELKENIQNEFSNIVNNNLTKEVISGKYISIYNFAISYEPQNKIGVFNDNPVYGYKYIDGNLFYVAELPIKTDVLRGFINFNIDIDTFQSKIVSKYDSKYILVLNNSFLNNNLSYDKRIKNFDTYNLNKSFKINKFKKLQEELKLMTNEENYNLNVHSFVNLKSNFISISKIRDVKNNDIGEIIIAENNEKKDISKNYLQIMKDSSEQSNLIVILILMASSLILY